MTTTVSGCSGCISRKLFLKIVPRRVGRHSESPFMVLDQLSGDDLGHGTLTEARRLLKQLKRDPAYAQVFPGSYSGHPN